jgi:hypothetical protein
MPELFEPFESVERQLAEAVEQGLATDDWSLLEVWMVNHCSFSFDCPQNDVGNQYPEHLLGRILQLLQSPATIEHRNAHRLVRIIEYEWSNFSALQRREIRQVFELIFPHMADWLAQFVIVEILGDFDSDPEAFEVFDRLIVASSGTGRQLLPMGLDYVIRGSSDPSIHVRALSRLRVLAADSSPEVRQEALMFLKRHVGEPPRRPTRKAKRHRDPN